MSKAHPSQPPAGVIDVSPAAPGTAAKAAGKATGFYRIRIFLPTGPEPGAPDHVVAGRDEIEAEAVCYKELGIRSVNKSENTVEISIASEGDYIKAQAKRLGVDLRQQRKTDVPADDAEHGKLTWYPGGGTPRKTYWVSDTGEVLDKKPTKEG